MPKTSAAASFAHQFASYKKAHDDAVQAAAAVAEKIEALRSEAQAINAAPLNCADFCELLGADIDGAARSARANFRHMVLSGAKDVSEKRQHRTGHYLGPTHFSFGGQTDRLGLGWSTLKRMVCMGEPSLVMSADDVTPETLCGLFGDAIKKAMTETLMASEWPFPDAQPIAQRLARLKAIEEEIAALEAEREGLQALIDQKNALTE